MLVHICCSVDSHYFLQELQKVYPNETLRAFFYNPNIHPKEEYDLRLLDVKRSCDRLGVDLIVGDYDFISWFDSVRGFEDEEEKGARCNICFDERLLKTAILALDLDEDSITTTLLASPMKSRDELFAQGESIAQTYNLKFIKIDVRANGGTQRQAKMAKDSNLYRQNYCGCQFALNKQRNRAGKSVLEMFEDIGRQILPGSAKAHIETFIELSNLERKKIPHILQKNSIQAYRILRGFVEILSENGRKSDILPSYIFTHSKSCKNLKSGTITWRTIKHNNINLTLGFCDNMLLATIESINLAFGANYTNVTQMLYNPPLYSDELAFRNALLGSESIKPLIVLDSAIEQNLRVNIDSITQNVDIFELLKLEL